MEIRYFGDPVLRRHTGEVKQFDRQLRDFARRMLETMYASRGVGLAAPQVGSSRRLLVLDLSEEHNESQVMVNPQIIRRRGEEREAEGCLSIPGLQVEVARAEEIDVRYQDLSGRERIERGKGLWARAVQHEMDHLEGRLLVDYLAPEDRRRFEDEEWPAQRECWESRREAGEAGGDSSPECAGMERVEERRL